MTATVPFSLPASLPTGTVTLLFTDIEEYGHFLVTMGRFDEGLALTHEAIRRDPLSVGPAHNLGIIAMIHGNYEEAAAAFRRAIDKLEQLHVLEAKQYVDPVTFAQIHGALGELDESLRWYEKAFADRTPNMVYGCRPKNDTNFGAKKSGYARL